ncbi:MAG: complex I NDUFA9 subunit family protein [SAR202 cluster bacterium]|nr:complex I NDUFA9 subunit family protein [SAR202 cluster bacterium]
MTVLVTGATGFVGRRVAAGLASRGTPVRALSRASKHAPQGIESLGGDVLDPPSLAKVFQAVDSVIHLVAVIREQDRLTFQRVNYEGTRNVLDAARAAGVRRLVYASTIGVTSDPSYRYLHSRWLAEQDVARAGIPFTILRFSVGFGEGDEFFNVLAAQVKLAPVVPVIGTGRARFQPIAVDDVARCLIACLDRPDLVDKTLEVGGPDHLTYDQMLDLVSQTVGAHTLKLHLPAGMAKPAVWAMERIMTRPPVTLEQLKMLRHDSVTGLDSVETVFGFRPQPVKGNLDYIKRMGYLDALRINMGWMPRQVRDH